jgi:hypothetical protein
VVAAGAAGAAHAATSIAMAAKAVIEAYLFFGVCNMSDPHSFCLGLTFQLHQCWKTGCVLFRFMTLSTGLTSYRCEGIAGDFGSRLIAEHPPQAMPNESVASLSRRSTRR